MALVAPVARAAALTCAPCCARGEAERGGVTNRVSTSAPWPAVTHLPGARRRGHRARASLADAGVSAEAAAWPGVLHSWPGQPEERLAARRGGHHDASELATQPQSLSLASALDPPLWLPSAAGTPPPPGGPDNEYYLQCGLAIRTIRDEWPHLFERDLSFHIYRPDIVFTDHVALPGVPATASGVEAYKRVFWSLRLHGALFFTRAHVSILRIWQPRERTLAVRWSIAAQPRLLSSFGAEDVHYDGISEYKLDSRGLIYEHAFNNLDWGGEAPKHSRSLASLLATLAPNQSPTPSFLEGMERRPETHIS